MVNWLGNRRFCLWDFGNDSSHNIFCWNLVHHRLLTVGRRGWSLRLCLSHPDGRRISLADLDWRSVSDRGNLSVGESAPGGSFAHTFPGHLSSFGRRV